MPKQIVRRSRSILPVQHGVQGAEAALLARSPLCAGLDMAVHTLDNAIHRFARNPDQCRVLREDPSPAHGWASLPSIVRRTVH